MACITASRVTPFSLQSWLIAVTKSLFIRIPPALKPMPSEGTVPERCSPIVRDNPNKKVGARPPLKSTSLDDQL